MIDNSQTDVLNDMYYLVNNLEQGDVIQLYDTTATTNPIHHSMIITSIDKASNDIKYAQHTDNGPVLSLRDKISLNAFNNEKIFFYDMK